LLERVWRLAVVSTAFAICCSAEKPVEPAKDHPYRRGFMKKTFGISGAIDVGVSSTIQHVRNSPKEWGRSVGGFSKRVGSSYGRMLVKNSIKYPIASLRHEALGYQPSGKEGFRPRLQYALLSTVITRKTTTGERTMAVGQITGTIGGGLISRLWQPASLHTWASGFSSSGISFGVDAGVNVVREFWPEIRRRKTRKTKTDPQSSEAKSAFLERKPCSRDSEDDCYQETSSLEPDLH